MRILLDECVDPRCKQFFDRKHDVLHVKDVGWLGTRNGELVAKADLKFDVLFTKDSNMIHQTSLRGLELSVAYTAKHPKAVEDYREVIEQFELICDSMPNGKYKNLDA